MNSLCSFLVALLLMIPLSSPAADLSSSALNPEAAKPPAAPRHPKTVGLHGDKIDDPYFWLREKDNPGVLDHLKAENAYTAAVMAPFKPFEDALYKELLGRIKQTDVSVPYRQRGYWLYHRTEEGKQYRILCRKKARLDAPEEVVLDVNKLAEGQKFMALGAFDYSDDNALLAYSTDVSGSRDYDFHLKNLATGKEIKTPIGKVADLAWAADNNTLFYVTEDDAKRSYRLWRYTLGEKDPALIYEEKDELFEVGIGRSHDRKFLFAGSASSRTTEFRFLPADHPKGEFQLIAPRRDEIEYYPEHRDGLFYLRTNDGAKEFRVMAAPVATPGVEHWKQFQAGSASVKIEDFELFAHYAVIVEREAGLTRFRVQFSHSKKEGIISMPEAAYDAALDENPEFDAESFRFSYESPVTPPSVFECRFDGGERKLLKRTEVLGGYDPERYMVERVQVTAADGTRIPLDIVRKKDVPLDGNAPCWLYGYGSYGISIDPSFSSQRLSLLDRGVIFALAHIRGGGEMGEAWHEGARMMTKKNTFTDFIACGDYLVANHYTAHDRMVIEGGSAGGLLLGAVLNLRPDFCKAAVMVVPFVDVLNTMSDATLPLTTGEYIEWGNPNKKDAYDYIKSYSPYDNLAAKDYPAILLMTSLNDSQVPYWEPAKYAAKLRTLKTDKNPLLFKINLDAGHGGASGRYDRLREIAFQYTFGLAILGLAK
jgi:oligopeptidase B